MIRGYRTFREFRQSGEGIATNILANRLRTLQAAGILVTELDKTDARRLNYRLTQKGIDLAPALFELLLWGARQGKSGAPCAAIENMSKNREALLAEVRKRWKERDFRPLQVNGRWIWP